MRRFLTLVSPVRVLVDGCEIVRGLRLAASSHVILVLCSAVGLSTTVATGHAQDLRASLAPCAACRLTFETVVRFGADGTLVGATSSVVRHSAGWLLAHEYDISRVSVFDGSGSKTASVGRKGAGPGEYEAIGEIIVSPLDSVFVIDAHADRISVLDPRLRFVRTEPLPLNSAEADVLPDGSFLFNATVGTRDALGYPLHVVRNGRIVGSFGAVDPIYRRDMPNLGKRTISRIRGRHVWIAHWGRYRLERWNVETRTLERTIERPVPWFPDAGFPGLQCHFVQGLLRHDAGVHRWQFGSGNRISAP